MNSQARPHQFQPKLDTELFPASLSGSRASNTGSRTSRLRSHSRLVVAGKTSTDLHVVHQAIAGDTIAQEHLFKTHAAMLYHKAFAVLRNKQDAQDALQDAWLRAYSNLHSYQGRSSFATWLTQIAINSALMILRRNRNRREVSCDEPGEASFVEEIVDRSRNPEEILLENERKAILRNTVRTLRPRIRVVVETGPLQSRSPNEAAHRLGITPQAAKGRLFHARAALRKSAVLRAVA